MTIDERKKRFEQEFQHEQELLFKVKARRNRLFAEWVVELLELSENRSLTYIKEMINFALSHDGEQKAIEKAKEDFAKHNIEITEHKIEKEYALAFEKAKDEIHKEG